MSDFEWIPTAERMPKMNGEGEQRYSDGYLITVYRNGIDAKPFVDYGHYLEGYDNCNKQWLCSKGIYDAKDVHAWKLSGVVL